MHTKKDLSDLRNTLIEKKNDFDFRAGWSTVWYIYNAITIHNEPSDLEKYMKTTAKQVKGLPVASEDVDYVLAYDILFGDITTVPIHINDAFELISAWRLKNPDCFVD